MFKKVKNLVVGHTAEMGKNKAGTLSLTLKKHPCYSLSILPFTAEVFTESLTLCEPIFWKRKKEETMLGKE